MIDLGASTTMSGAIRPSGVKFSTENILQFLFPFAVIFGKGGHIDTFELELFYIPMN